MDEYIGTVEYFTSSTLCGIELNRHIGDGVIRRVLAALVGTLMPEVD
jgi:hypothetical protein